MLWRVFTVYFVPLLPNVSNENIFDLRENEGVVETHFLYG